ncbi:hypothetical protein [Pigmentiphaga sp.]|nr:hypothetical protein [Pigmentiphaga sp.]
MRAPPRLVMKNSTLEGSAFFSENSGENAIERQKILSNWGDEA